VDCIINERQFRVSDLTDKEFEYVGTKGLDEQGIKNIFKSAEVKISWATKDGTNKESVFNLGDIIQFK